MKPSQQCHHREDLPNELWSLIFHLFQSHLKTLQTTRAVCKRWRDVISHMPLPLNMLIVPVLDGLYEDRLFRGLRLVQGLPETVSRDSFSRMNESLSAPFPLYSDDSDSIWLRCLVNISDQVCHLSSEQFSLLIRSRLASKTGLLNIKPRFKRAIVPDFDTRKYSYRDVILTVGIALNLEEITLRCPSTSFLLPPSQRLTNLRFLDVLEVHRQLDLSSLPPTLRGLSLDSDGRLQDETGIILHSSFRPLCSRATPVTCLRLQGPWLQHMIEYPAGLLSIIHSLSSLTTLCIDLDYPARGSDAILSLFSALPHLKSFGRLGRVNKSFWRLTQKAQGSHLRHLSLGTPKYPYAHRLTPNLEFLRDLAMGVLWFAPCLETLELWMNYTGEDETLRSVLQRIKKGVDWDLPQGITPKKLKKIKIYQVLDLNALDDRAWKRLATLPVTHPLEIQITSHEYPVPNQTKYFP